MGGRERESLFVRDDKAAKPRASICLTPGEKNSGVRERERERERGERGRELRAER